MFPKKGKALALFFSIKKKFPWELPNAEPLRGVTRTLFQSNSPLVFPSYCLTRVRPDRLSVLELYIHSGITDFFYKLTLMLLF